MFKKVLLAALTLTIVGAGTAVVLAQGPRDAAGGGTPTPPAMTSDAVDISGPCDEAEHADDPRCTGASRADNSGPGSAGSHRFDDCDDRHDDDRRDGRDDDDRWDERYDDDREDDDRDDWDDRWDRD